MSETKFVINHSKGFRARRGLNWFSLGLMYATYYMCRYNFKHATPHLREEFGFDESDLGWLLAIWSLAYGTGQLINGLISDRIGGKRCMLIGAVGTITISFFFGFAPWVSTFTTFAMLSLINGYFQSFGAPGMVKINSAWFHRTERGTFAGIFGVMIQSGQAAINALAPFLLSTTVVVGGLYLAEKGEWRYLFRIPPLFTAAAALFLVFAVKQSPDEAGYKGEIEDEVDNSEGVTVPLLRSLKTILTHPLVWFYAVAYACTGGVRSSLDGLSNLYFEDQLQFDMKANIPTSAKWTLLLMPVFAVTGSIISGIISDKFFTGRRAPVAMVLYLIEAAVIGFSAIVLLNGWVGPTTAGIWIGCLILIMISLTVNSTHSLVGAAAPMDIGGKKMAGFAAGVIDSFQYYGAAISLVITGWVLTQTKEQYGWLFWYVIMATWGLIGAFAMFLLMMKQRRLRAEGRDIAG